MQKYTFLPLAAAVLLTSCADAVLSDSPIVNVNIEATWDGQNPHYEVSFTTDDQLKVHQVAIAQQYHDLQGDWTDDHPSEEVIKLPITGPYSYTDTGKFSYPGDIFVAFAYLTTDQGMFRSDVVNLTVPGTTNPLIQSASFTFDDKKSRRGTVHVYGTNFSQRPGVIYPSLDYYSGFDYDYGYPSVEVFTDSVLFHGIYCNRYGDNIIYLKQYRTSYTLNVHVYGITIDRLDPISIHPGEPLDIHFTNDGNIDFKPTFSFNHILVEHDDSHMRIVPIYNELAYHVGYNDITFIDPVRGIINKAPDKLNVTVKDWNSWGSYGSQSCRVGDYICTYGSGKIHVFNPAKGQEEFSYQVPSQSGTNTAKLLSIGDRYVYLWRINIISSKSYLGRYDLQESRWEELTTLGQKSSNAWFDDEATLRVLAGESLFTYHIDTGSWDPVISTSEAAGPDGIHLNRDCNVFATSGGYVYFMLDGSVYRYPAGSPSAIQRIGRPVIPISIPLGVSDDCIYYAFNGATMFEKCKCFYLYRVPVASLLDGSNSFTSVSALQYENASSSLQLYDIGQQYVINLNGELQHQSK